MCVLTVLQKIRETRLSKESTNKTAVPFARDNLPGLVSNSTANVINKFGRKISGEEAVRAWKEFTLLILNEGMNDTIKALKL